MSELEKNLQAEVDRLKEWSEGQDFRLSTFSTGPNRCRRCRLEKSRVWVLAQNPSLSFSEIDFTRESRPITSENVCRDCLTDGEIATLLAPVTIFCLTSLLAQPAPDGKGTSVLTGDIAHSVAHVKTYLEIRQPGPVIAKQTREASLRALDGLHGVPPPEIDLHALSADLEEAIARNIYFAAHPDDLPSSIEESRAISDKVHLFFRDRASIESFCLRDSVIKCVELFRRYFVRRAI